MSASCRSAKLSAVSASGGAAGTVAGATLREPLEGTPLVCAPLPDPLRSFLLRHAPMNVAAGRGERALLQQGASAASLGALGLSLNEAEQRCTTHSGRVHRRTAQVVCWLTAQVC
eukprot:scaffold6045_cov188-Prasinococcus_capsulatus_cf.AAC.4